MINKTSSLIAVQFTFRLNYKSVKTQKIGTLANKYKVFLTAPPLKILNASRQVNNFLDWM